MGGFLTLGMNWSSIYTDLSSYLYDINLMHSSSLLSWKDFIPGNPKEMNNQEIEGRLVAMSSMIRA
jgi:hypothetical protein